MAGPAQAPAMPMPVLASKASLAAMVVTFHDAGAVVPSRSSTPSPLFSPTVYRYVYKVPHAVTKVDITAFAPRKLYVTPLPAHLMGKGKSSVSISGRTDGMQVGKNVVKVTVVSEDGRDTQVYMLNIIRKRSTSISLIV
mmetsp:Transcript_31308/g.99899  ORF Transcript_31308/g.99899 Transcript_31308/m.99899 type:complete len:139 (+) Transcript_31308:150-566(+)